MSRPDRANRVVTIVAACLATAMLMLDISVINTALSSIAHGLDTGLGGLQWVVDAYTIPLAATVPHVRRRVPGRIENPVHTRSYSLLRRTTSTRGPIGSAG